MVIQQKDRATAHAAPAEPWETLAASMRETLADNLHLALAVAGEEEGEGESTGRMNLSSLSQKTKIARSTISKLRNEQTSTGIAANPDLNTLCRLAAALNLPPAFLLMSSKDWQRLLGALNGLQGAFAGTCLDEAALEAAGNDTVGFGVRLAKEMGVYAEHARMKLTAAEAGVRQREIDEEMEKANAMRLLAIHTTTAVVQSSAKNLRELATLTAIGALFGASYKST